MKPTARVILFALLLLGAVSTLVWKASKPATNAHEPGLQARPLAEEPSPPVPRTIASRNAPVETFEPAITEEPAPTTHQHELVREWLKTRNENAANLLAAFRATGDTNFLFEAAAKFPGDPQVQMTVLTRNVFPDERRKWIDALKTSSPDSAAANYLSAQDHLKNGNTQAAFEELAAASGKTNFGGHSLESFLDAESLHQFLGKPPLEAAREAMSNHCGDLLEQLPTFKQLQQSMNEYARSYKIAGDFNSVENLAQSGTTLSRQLRNSESGKLLIVQMVSDGLNALALSELAQDQSYGFLDGATPADELNKIKERKAEWRSIMSKATALLPAMNDAELEAYMDRMKIYGELHAMRWLIQQHPSGD